MRTWARDCSLSVLLSAVLCVVGGSTPALSTGSQFSLPSLWWSIRGLDIAIGDFNGDGALDLVVAQDFGSFMEVHLGAGNGTFLPGRAYQAGPQVRSVAVGDLNEDGHQDVVTASGVVFGVGDGTFGPPVLLAIPTQIAEFSEVGDFNADGHLDVAVAIVSGTRPKNDDVSILIGHGDGTFAPEVRYEVGNLPRTLAVADFNGDGNLDLAAANRNPPVSPRPDGKDEVSILLGNGDGTFQGQRIVPAENIRLNGLAVGDFNRDGNPDFAVGTEGESGISIHLGNGDGSFAPGTRVEVGACPVKLALGDFDLDGNQDLATSNWCGLGDVGVLLGDGGGSLTLDGIFPTDIGAQPGLPRGFTPVSIAAGDFDGDGRQDLATANNVGSVSTLLNQGPFSGCLDADGDGFGFPGNPSCAGGLSLDCNDDNAGVNPGVTEICDTIDNNCDGSVDLIVQAACSAAPSTLNLSSNGEGFSFDVSLTNLCTGNSVDPSLLAPTYISGFSSASTGTTTLPVPFAGPGCNDLVDDGIWEDINARKMFGGNSATLNFSLPSDGLCATLDGNRQEIIAIMQDVPDGEDADLCITSTYPGDPAVLQCCDAIRVMNKGSR